MVLFVFVFVGVGVVVLIVRPYPFLITIVVLIVGVVGVSKDSMLCKHNCGLINLEGRSVLGVIGVGRFVLFFLIIKSFAAFAILVTRFPTVAAGFGLAIAKMRFVGFAFPFGSAFVAFAFSRAGVGAVRREATVTGPFPFSTTFTFVTVVSPPFVVGGGGIVRDCGFGRERIAKRF